MTGSQRDILRHQQGVITRSQALGAGLTDKAIETRLRTGRWQRLHPGVYATFNGVPSRPALLWAAVLRAGRDAALSHETAAELHGLLDSPARVIHVTVPSSRRIARPAGVALHYSSLLAQSRHPALVPPRTRVEDTVLDLVDAARTADDAAGVILRAVASRRTTSDRLLAAARRRLRLRWRAEVTQALGAAAIGAHSLLEYRYGVRVEGPHGLPRGRRQRPVLRAGRRQYQDVSYDDYGLLVELDGQTAHPLSGRWTDIRRDNANAAAGQATIRLWLPDVSEGCCATAALVAQALQARGWVGDLRRCGNDCAATGAGPSRPGLPPASR